MQYAIRMIPACGSPEAEAELNHLLRSRRVIHAQQHLEVFDGSPCWCFCVEWLEGGPASGGRGGGP